MKIFAYFILIIIFLTGSNIHCQTLVGTSIDVTEFIKAPQSNTTCMENAISDFIPRQ
jgi:hypothetical protein